jgi:hypothetical protein
VWEREWVGKLHNDDDDDEDCAWMLTPDPVGSFDQCNIMPYNYCTAMRGSLRPKTTKSRISLLIHDIYLHKHIK